MKKINLTTVKSVLESLGQIIVIAGIAAVLLCIMASCDNDLIGERTRKNVLNPLPLTVINQAGGYDENMNIVFLPERYAATEMQAFRNEVNMAWEILRATAPYSYSLDKINVFAVEVPSPTDSTTVFGMAKPQPDQVYVPIRFDSIRSVMNRLPFKTERTVLVVITNARESYLGFTHVFDPTKEMYIPPTAVIQSLLSYRESPQIFLHELSHCNLLGDEYSYEGTQISEEEIAELEEYHKAGMFLNVTANQENFWWQDFIGDDDYADSKIDLYEGGYCFEKSVWRPTQNSVMRHHYSASYHSPVDRYLIYCDIERMHSGRTISYEEWKAIDLAHPQQPIDFAEITGNRANTRSLESITHDYNYNDLIIVK